jgi:hypothetical protein
VTHLQFGSQFNQKVCGLPDSIKKLILNMSYNISLNFKTTSRLGLVYRFDD